MAVGKEKEFELEFRVRVTGYGKERHWVSMARSVKRVLAVHLGECHVSCDRVRVPGGEWYECGSVSGLGYIPPFDYEGGD